MRSITQNWRLLSSATVMVLLLANCGDDGAGNPATAINGEADPEPEITACCEEKHTMRISGIAPAGGQYYWASLMNADTVIRYGDSVLLSGIFSDVPLSVHVNYRDRIPGGQYVLRANASLAPTDVGVAAKVTSATEGKVVEVQSFNTETCFECDTVEVKFRTFIACPIVNASPPGFQQTGWFGYYSGDGRSFGYDMQGFRTAQVVKLAYRFDTGEWHMSSADAFGITKEWPTSEIAEDGGQTECYKYYLINDPPSDTSCIAQAQVGVDGNILSETLTDFHIASQLRLVLSGKNPCISPSCAIDGNVELLFSVVMVDDLPEIRVAGSIQHDRYPWYELYARRLAGLSIQTLYTWDASNENFLSLCTWLPPGQQPDTILERTIKWDPYCW